MKKLFLCLMFLLYGCSLPITYNDTHQPKNPNANLLPALHTKVNTQNLKAVFSDITNDKKKPDYNMRNMIADDAVNIFEREVEENITTGSGVKKGYISLRIQYVQLNHSFGYRAATIASLGLLSVVGVPVDKYTQTMEVEVEIADNRQAVIKRYTEVVESSAYHAFYWGYKRPEINRKVAADNMKKAMAAISKKINADAPEIKKSLK
ncbi:MAG: hypothetical protein IKO06_00425 [Alphaproteobacteria bacterium]|nr:hypothetical protein [Alphaproteobacteria bacterium]